MSTEKAELVAELVRKRLREAERITGSPAYGDREGAAEQADAWRYVLRLLRAEASEGERAPVYDEYPYCAHCGARRCHHYGYAEWCAGDRVGMEDGPRYTPSGQPHPLVGWRPVDSTLRQPAPAPEAHHPGVAEIMEFERLTRQAFALASQGERERVAEMFDTYRHCVAGVFRRAVETATAKLHKDADAAALLTEALAAEVAQANEIEARILAALGRTPEPRGEHPDDPQCVDDHCHICGEYESECICEEEDALEAEIVPEWELDGLLEKASDALHDARCCLGRGDHRGAEVQAEAAAFLARDAVASIAALHNTEPRGAE